MRLESGNIYLRFYEVSDAEQVLAMVQRNREFFRGYMPEQGEAYFTLEGQRAGIERGGAMREAGSMYSFAMFLKETDEYIGGVTLANVVRGPLQSCIFGYFLDQEHNGKGLMTEAARMVVRYAFEELGLNRIEASVMPHNLGSLRILEKIGFQREGLARQCVQINGKWEDHVTLSLLSSDVRVTV